MGRCEAGRYDKLELIEAESGLPVSICDKKATHTIMYKTLEKVCKGTGKGHHHVCAYHFEWMKEWFENRLDEGVKTICPECGITHENATIRYRFRKGIH